MDGEARNHDAVGNTTSIGGKTFTYNDANRMNAVKQGDAVLESYAYNHRGERVLRTPAGGAAQITLYDEAGQWLGNYSATGQAQQQAIWLDNYPVALINTPATGVPELAYVQPDHLGTPRVVIDPVRNVSIWGGATRARCSATRFRVLIRMAMVWRSSWRCASPGSRRRMRVGCSTTIGGNTTRQWGGIPRAIRLG